MPDRPLTGQPVSRLEGVQKVTGAARYAGEYPAEDLLYGYVVNSTVSKGRIVYIDTAAVKAIPGVIDVLTHEHRPRIARLDLMYADMDAPSGSPFRPLHKADICYNGQPVALVVAETFELARYAASRLKIRYETTDFETDLMANLDRARAPRSGMAASLKPPPPPPSGDFERAYSAAHARAAATFIHGTEHHNPMELFATTTIYEGEGKLTIYDKTQGTNNVQLYVGNVFGLHFKDVRVIAPYVGGAFGSGLRPQYQLFLSVLAALHLKRSVRVTLDRQQMFTFGHRPPTIQRNRFGANKDGTVTALNHDVIAETSRFEDYTEVVANWSHILYPARNTLFRYNLVPLDVYTPLDMRAPGGSTALHAIEVTMDMLAYELKMDPLELRLLNYTEVDVSAKRPFSSKELRQCYLQGAEKFGWYGRNPAPRSMKRGNRLVGYGMATGIWEAMTLPARASAALMPDGQLEIRSAVTDIGTGTLTVMTQIAADEFGLPADRVSFLYGDSKLPLAPIQGGSFTVSTVGSAVVAACRALKRQLLKKAGTIRHAQLAGASLEDVIFRDGRIYRKADPVAGTDLMALIAANKGKPFKTTKTAVPGMLKLKKYTRAAHSAAFVEVEVDEQLGVIKVTRALTAVAAGRIINPKTARSQILGGMVWGISKALHEETLTDHNLGRYLNHNLGEYHIPVHADVHDLDVLFIDEQDDIVNRLGTKGVGEIGLTAMPPAIANAVYHATGRRHTNLPIHFNELL